MSGPITAEIPGTMPICDREASPGICCRSCACVSSELLACSSALVLSLSDVVPIRPLAASTVRRPAAAALARVELRRWPPHAATSRRKPPSLQFRWSRSRQVHGQPRQRVVSRPRRRALVPHISASRRFLVRRNTRRAQHMYCNQPHTVRNQNAAYMISIVSTRLVPTASCVPCTPATKRTKPALTTASRCVFPRHIGDITTTHTY